MSTECSSSGREVGGRQQIGHRGPQRRAGDRSTLWTVPEGVRNELAGVRCFPQTRMAESKPP